MLYRLKRHPFVMQAILERTIVLTYAVPVDILKSALPPGLSVDALGNLGFIAIALVQTRNMRPAFFPKSFGQDFFMGGCRILARYVTPSRKSLRGLRIIESYTDSKRLAIFSALLTHYQYHVATIQSDYFDNAWRIKLNVASTGLELDVIVKPNHAILPAGSPFKSFSDARKYAGPLPFTFDYEPETGSIVMVEGVRQNWKPRLVEVRVNKNTLLEKPPFNASKPLLAAAFYIENVPYLWKKGVAQEAKKEI